MLQAAIELRAVQTIAVFQPDDVSIAQTFALAPDIVCGCKRRFSTRLDQRLEFSSKGPLSSNACKTNSVQFKSKVEFWNGCLIPRTTSITSQNKRIRANAAKAYTSQFVQNRLNRPHNVRKEIFRNFYRVTIVRSSIVVFRSSKERKWLR